MIVERVIATGKSEAQPVRARLPAPEQPINQKNEEIQKLVKKKDLSDLEEFAADVQKNLNIMHNVDLRFSVHKGSGQIMVTVIDETTGEVIREIPSSELLNLAAKLEEMVGILFDQKG